MKFEFVTVRSVVVPLNISTAPPAFAAVTFESVTLVAALPKLKADPPEPEAVTFVSVRPLTGP